MQTSVLNMRLPADAYEAAKAAAKKRGVSLSAHVRDLLVATPGQLLASASGGKYSAAYCTYALLTADRLVDSPENFGTALCDWLAKADETTDWLRHNPYHSAAPGRVAELFGNIPAAITTAMRGEVAA